MIESSPSTPESLVVIARSAVPRYEKLAAPQSAPELPCGEVRTVAEAAVRELLRTWGLDAGRFGTRDWNPFGALVTPNARLVLKPNWVLHYNQSGESLDCLVTHPSLIEAVAQYAALNRPAAMVIGDAPIQGCDFQKLSTTCDLRGIAERISNQHGFPCRIVDFRRTVLHGGKFGGSKQEGVRELDRYILFDLAERSLLETYNWERDQLRVTMYNPDLLNRTHTRGRHQYLIAREVIEADAVINLPKLKTHMKAGVTGALKNLVGINGNKEYLPHHRKGGVGRGGDCYDGGSWLKLQAEHFYDVANRSKSTAVQTVASQSATVLVRAAAVLGEDRNMEGAWYGNDTVWRMCLDLQRLLRYGRTDGSIESSPQRRVISITDGIIAGEGQGPLANTPYPAGFLTGGLSTAAVEWVNTRLMGFDPVKIPIVREAFSRFELPLTDFNPSGVVVQSREGRQQMQDIAPPDRPFVPPSGWRGHCEL